MGQVSHDGSCASTGAAAHTGGNEYHVGAFQGLGDEAAALFCGLLADLGLGASAHAAGQLFADLDLVGANRLVQVLLIGIDYNKIDAVYAAFDHAVDNIVAGAADTNDFNLNYSLLENFSHNCFPPMYVWSRKNFPTPFYNFTYLFYPEKLIWSIEKSQNSSK